MSFIYDFYHSSATVEAAASLGFAMLPGEILYNRLPYVIPFFLMISRKSLINVVISGITALLFENVNKLFGKATLYNE